MSSLSYLPAEVGFNAALKELKNRYGDCAIVENAYIKRVLDWPVIKIDDAKSPDEFSMLLTECLYAVNSVKAMNVLGHTENIKGILRKQPLASTIGGAPL